MQLNGKFSKIRVSLELHNRRYRPRLLLRQGVQNEVGSGAEKVETAPAMPCGTFARRRPDQDFAQIFSRLSGILRG